MPAADWQRPRCIRATCSCCRPTSLRLFVSRTARLGCCSRLCQTLCPRVEIDRMKFHPGSIDAVLWKPLAKFHDPRGWLCELFRHDELAAEFHPVMAYASVTLPGVARGPHEHVDQTDCFCFIGPSIFKVYLWDRRLDSPTYLARYAETVGV